MTDLTKYACGCTPRAGDMIEFGSRADSMIVSRVVDDGDDDVKIIVGGDVFHPHLAVLVARFSGEKVTHRTGHRRL